MTTSAQLLYVPPRRCRSGAQLGVPVHMPQTVDTDHTAQARHLPRTVRLRLFFQAEDGIRDLTVTGVQTCALPISVTRVRNSNERKSRPGRQTLFACVFAASPSHSTLERRTLSIRLTPLRETSRPLATKIGRASCRERV